MRGLLGYATYIPYHRLDRSKITAALGQPSGKGTRAVASYDEDATSMAVEACRALMASGSPVVPDSVSFASTTPPYLDKTNATAIHAALNLPSSVFAADVGGAPRSVNAALRSALQGTRPALITAADVRTGRPGSADETATGDGAAAWLVGSSDDGPLLAEWLGGASATAEFLDRWRLPEWDYSRVWEERFGEHAYLPLVTEAANAAFKETGIEPDDVSTVIITGLHTRAVRGAARAAGLDGAKIVDNLNLVIGNTGTPHSGIMLASVLDQAAAGETIMVIHLADGCDVGFLRTTEALTDYTAARPVATQIAQGNAELSYEKFLTWRGHLTREPPRRPDPPSPAAPPSYRQDHWKFAFIGSKDRTTGAIHLPPQRVSVKGGAVDDMELVPMADVPATVATYTIDRLAYSLSPPTIAVVIDFDGGGRFQCQLTDADPNDVKIGDRVEMSFRRLLTANGVHNYFWKAKPIR